MRIAVLGLGLIGGSLLRALAAAGHEARGYDAAPATRRAAGAVESVAEAVEGAELVFLAVPLPALPGLRAGPGDQPRTRRGGGPDQPRAAPGGLGDRGGRGHAGDAGPGGRLVPGRYPGRRDRAGPRGGDVRRERGRGGPGPR